MLVEIVKINKEDVAVVTSLDVAETFEKRHSDVLRDIEHLQCSDEFTQRNFALSSYKDASGKANKEYTMTRDGFSILVMGYTGEKAMKFKEAYIFQFNVMDRMLKDLLEERHRTEMERAKGIAVRQALTKTIQLSGENERMRGHAYSTYTNVIYKAIFGKNAKQLREVYGIGKKDELRDCFTTEELQSVQSAEMLVSGLINCGWGYDQIKNFVTANVQKQLAA